MKAGGGKNEAASRNFFENLGRKSDLQDWHYIQAVEAIELWAKKVASLDWAENFDWQGLSRLGEFAPHPLPRDQTCAIPHSHECCEPTLLESQRPPSG